MRIVDTRDSPRSPSPEDNVDYEDSVNYYPLQVDNNIYSPISAPSSDQTEESLNQTPQPGPSWWEGGRERVFYGVDKILRAKSVIDHLICEEINVPGKDEDFEMDLMECGDFQLLNEISFKDEEVEIVDIRQPPPRNGNIDLELIEEEVAAENQDHRQEEEIDIVGDEDEEIDVVGMNPDEAEGSPGVNLIRDSGYESGVSEAESEEMENNGSDQDPDYEPDSESESDEDIYIRDLDRESRLHRLKGLRRKYWRVRMKLLRLKRKKDLQGVSARIEQIRVQRERRRRQMDKNEYKRIMRIHRILNDVPKRKRDSCGMCGKLFWIEKIRKWIRCENCNEWLCPNCAEEPFHCEE